MYSINYYSTESGNVPVEKYIGQLAKKHKIIDIAAIESYIKRLSQFGLDINNHFRGSCKLLRDGVYELRPKTTRIFFFTFVDNTIVLLHAIEKKRSDVPPSEIERAIKEKNDYIRRYQNGKKDGEPF
ncbi:MAG: type II toxin-antitoxin system RelE/ParE family toxin [Clostridia bacterium]|nr:type II toxin-antitoxin system RelE/ParE family toxin [Clostridia bacterium]